MSRIVGVVLSTYSAMVIWPGKRPIRSWKRFTMPDSLFHKRMDFWMKSLIEGLIKDPVRTLSLGQRMRADIAASSSQSRLSLYEPTIGFDVSVKDNIRRAITVINQEKKQPFFWPPRPERHWATLVIEFLLIGQEIFDGTVSQLKETFGKMKTFSLNHTRAVSSCLSLWRLLIWPW